MDRKLSQMISKYGVCAAGLRKIFLFVCLILPLAGFQAKAASIPLVGVGATTPCSSWTWARGHQPAANDLQNWALGYFSGQEMAMSSNFLVGSSAGTLFQALDTQCLVQPNNSVADAVDILVMRFKEGL